MKNYKLYWSILSLLFIIQFFLQYSSVNSAREISEVKYIIVLTEILTTLITAFIPGIFLASLLSLFLLKKEKYKIRIKQILPITTSLPLLLYIISFSYILYIEEVKGEKLGPVIEYNDIKQSEGLDCESVKDGKFETKNLIIERAGNRQTQTDKNNGNVSEYEIKWLSNCEYELTPISYEGDNMLVKIVEVTEKYYDCFTTTGTYATKFRVQKL
ncbi:hypothetical protein [Flammeovirga kamogawensis]|uniref:Uncharacterized protein n=1 Tax=Flammeovirga kamogawensis TaxID=373891 RepID=A0ABX8H3D3_9BACT|nr:hypothetical protein [Flammeovirga kamogawensis]MBB6464100.1 hypothetical protein [Flammeovirga kamogawensis]QWG09897.1 hypothetical protein KM029_19645 [Flammeovirga kamogawensis]TRX65401.1 hypothetical protein EO216_23040 [Flammeovirga kamogawensis]